MENRIFSLPPNDPIPADWHNERYGSPEQLEHNAARLIGEAEDAFNLNPGLTEQIVEPKYITTDYGGDGKNGRPLIAGYNLGLKTIPPGVPDTFSDPQKDLTGYIISEATALTKKEIFPGQNSQQQAHFDSLMDWLGGTGPQPEGLPGWNPHQQARLDNLISWVTVAGPQPDVHEAGTIATALMYNSAGKTQLLNNFIHTVTDPSVRDKVFYSLAIQSANKSDSNSIADYISHISTPAKKELAQQAVDAALAHKIIHYTKNQGLHAAESYVKSISDPDIRLWAREIGPKVVAETQKRKRREAEVAAAMQKARMMALMG